MKQTLRKHNTELDSLRVSDNKLAIFTLQSQVTSLKENIRSLMFNGESIEFKKKECPTTLGELQLRKSNVIDLEQNVNEVDILPQVIELVNLHCEDEGGFNGEGHCLGDEPTKTSYIHFNDNRYAIFLYFWLQSESYELVCFFYNADHTLIEEKRIRFKHTLICGIESNGEQT